MTLILDKNDPKIVNDAVCNLCHKSCLDNMGMNKEYSTLSARWGYYSPWDDEAWLAHFCINCSLRLKEWIEANGGKIAGNHD